ncbi:AI-2E family transporter [Microbaculum marinum]|uniref:AI-2E family transporter n=1 Tax=Microbaculum marinum TaxID=1764581 RepID=A0AAW9RM47_9HYPH
MTLQRQLVFWFVALLLLIVVLFVLRPILLPFVAGMALAYALDPLADRLQRLGLSRLLATSVILVAFALVFILFLVALVPLLSHQLSQLMDDLPQYSSRLQDLFNSLTREWMQVGWVRDLLGMEQGESAPSAASRDLLGKAAGWVGQLVQGLVTGGLALVNLFALLTVTPVVAFYLLNDWDRMMGRIDSWLPREHADTIRSLAHQIDDVLAGFVRGQGLLCLVLGTFYAIGLSVIGLNFGLVIGFGAGLISFIPYIGSIVGFLVSMGVALAQFWPDWIMITAVAAVFLAGQFLEGNILQPKLVGGHIGLHPVWLIFALFAFGYLFGFVGMLLAVPLAAALGVLARFLLQQYLDSKLYKGGSGEAPPS